MLQEDSGSLVYCLQLSGISCTNCEAKIKKNLTEQVTSGLEKVSVNILQEKVTLTLKNEDTLKDAVDTLASIGYKVIGEPNLLKGGSHSTRTVSFIYEINADSQKIEAKLRETSGVTSLSRVHLDSSIKLTVSYDCNILKGREIADVIAAADPNYETINHRVLSFRSERPAKQNQIDIRWTMALCAFFAVFDMFLPLSGMWFDDVLLFPTTKFGPLTLSVVINIIFTSYVLKVYALPFISRSLRNYIQNGSMDMETLISLGCSSAFLLFCFFMGKSFYQMLYTEDYVISAHEIMEINDALASSAIIVLVVTIGKYFEGKVKRKIEQMSESIFPESKLFENMKVLFVRLKNRKLMVESKTAYDVTVLERDDIYELAAGRVLLDSIVLSGEFEAVKSAVDGNDQVSTLKKGERIESGSVVLNCSDNALLQVEKIFEKSVLVEIGTHIKLRENEQENQQSGIQAVCKTISRYFVKAVIFISLAVMVTWTFLITFDYVTVPGCNFCWVVERGIGVLVASCPCALGLAVPSVIAIVLNIAIRNGILIRNSGVLQKMKKCRIISFDKTGTLFTRINQIEEYEVFNKEDEEMKEQLIWQMVAVVEKSIQHPLAEILYKEAYRKCGVEGTNFEVILNSEVQVKKNGITAEVLLKKSQQVSTVLIGNRKLLEQNGIAVPEFEKRGIGATVLFLAFNQKARIVMVINTHSNLRPEAARVVSLLMKNKKSVHILSGDSRESVEQLGQALKIPAECLHPEHSAFMKMQWIQETQKDLESSDSIGVIMVGDGLNDIPCLQEAAIGVSINAKSELNINASDIIMLSENLYKILAMVKLLERGNTFININLFWAFLYNITIMPVVAGVFYSYDITISPVWSSVAMSCSSILVVGFSHIMALFNYDDSPKGDAAVESYEQLHEISSKDFNKGGNYDQLNEQSVGK